MARRSGVSIRTTRYSGFKGVDFSTDPSLVDPYRSPVSVNMISDTGGMPEKRMGWRTLYTVEKPVNGLFVAVIKEKQRFIVHGGTKLYEFFPFEEKEPVELKTDIKSARSVAQNMGGKLWILTGGEYLVFDGETVKNVSEDAYIPTTIIGAAPAGGGETFEAPNLLQPKRKNEFIPDGTSKDYHLDSTDIDDTPVTAKVRDADKTEGTDFTVDRKKGIVTFNTAPEKPVVGQDGEVIITFSKSSEGYADRVYKCNIMTAYGVGNTDRIIIAGNPEFPNRDWTSGLNDPTYFPDLGYALVGTEATSIMGYRRIGEYLAIIKEDNGQDSTVFLRSASFDNASGEAVFQTKQSVAGVGAVAIGGFGNILDEQLFLSGTGVYAITTNALTAERIVQNRSFYVDPKLTKESGLEKAEAVSWNGMYLIGVNSHVYLLDGRQNRSYKAKSQGDFIYECYYWDNVPAVCWLDHKDGATETLFFGTAEGKICRFNSDIDRMERYSDDGAPILAVWSTKADDDDDVTLLKTMIKKGNSVTIKPYTRSSAKIYFRTEKDPVEWEAASDTLDIFDWEDIDFTRFTFEVNDAPREILFNTKVKKYKRLQIIVKNDALNEGFGIYGITKHFVVGNFAKR